MVLRKEDNSRMETPQMRFLIPGTEVILRDNCKSETIRGQQKQTVLWKIHSMYVKTWHVKVGRTNH
jgi:hypothetical protein